MDIVQKHGNSENCDNMNVALHPHYLPDLAPCSFSLFPRLKIKLKGNHFDTIKVTEAESKAVLKELTEHDFTMHLKIAEALEMELMFGWGLLLG
jgi:hypothetical protein